MKTHILILLLSFSVSAFGQNRYTMAISILFVEPMDTFIEIIPNIWYNEMRYEYRDSTQWYKNIDQFVSMYAKYEIQCYNDSTFMDGYVIGEDTLYSTHAHQGYVLIPRQKYKQWYTHGSPTLGGFMEYLGTLRK